MEKHDVYIDSNTDLSSDSNYIKCDRYHAIIKRSTCLLYQSVAKEADNPNCGFVGYKLDIAFDRKLSCLKCDMGRQVAQEEKERSHRMKKKTTGSPGNNAIDWEDLMHGYNRMYKKKYRSVRQWLFQMCRLNNDNLKATSEIIGVAVNTLRKRMVAYDPNWRQVQDRDAIFISIPASEMQNMTRIDISRKTGLGLSQIDRLIIKHNRKFKTRR